VTPNPTSLFSQRPNLERSPDTASDWLLWQLADSSFPSGGFAHSSGLEAAWQLGEIRTGEQLGLFAEAQFLQLRRFVLPFVAATHEEPSQLAQVDELFEQHTTNHIANQASRAQGLALLASARRIFGMVEITPPCGHLAPVFGVLGATLGLGRKDTLSLFAFNHLRNLTASAVRLNLVGPLEAQTLQRRLARLGQGGFESLPSLEHVAQTSPLLDLWQGVQTRLYSRLFRS